MKPCQGEKQLNAIKRTKVCLSGNFGLEMADGWFKFERKYEFMVDKLTKYEITILNRIISKTFENNDFDIFKIVSDLNVSLSGFDKQYVRSPDLVALRISNFLIDKRLAEKAFPDKSGFERILRWTEKGVSLKKYGNYRLYKIMVEMQPEIKKIIGLLTTIIAALLGVIQILKSCKS